MQDAGPVLRDPTVDAAEWAALELDRAAWIDSLGYYPMTDIRPAFTDRPHADSYGAHLPLRSTPEPVTKKPAPPTIRAGAHPDSYGAHLPLRGLALEGRRVMPSWKLTAAEKKVLAGRQVIVTPDVFVRVEAVRSTDFRGDVCPVCGKRTLTGSHIHYRHEVTT